MKVIGKIKAKLYLVEVDHTELEKFLNTYYGQTSELSVGDDVDLGAGYDHATKINEALRVLQGMLDSAETVTQAIRDCKAVKKNFKK